ncbi:leucine-rich repeat-containing protein 3B isoform 2-T9 [Hipposideros larvatus]
MQKGKGTVYGDWAFQMKPGGNCCKMKNPPAWKLVLSKQFTDPQVPWVKKFASSVLHLDTYKKTWQERSTSSLSPSPPQLSRDTSHRWHPHQHPSFKTSAPSSPTTPPQPETWRRSKASPRGLAHRSLLLCLKSKRISRMAVEAGTQTRTGIMKRHVC